MISYSFIFDPNNKVDFVIDENGCTSDIFHQESVQDWMKLEFEQCDECTIPESSRETCPAAVAIHPVISVSDALYSFDEVLVTVKRSDLNLEASTTTQRAIRSLIGLLLGLSECPLYKQLRPVAYFHLPFGDLDHRVFRILGMSLIKQYIRGLDGQTPDWELNDLRETLTILHRANRKLSRRIRAVCQKDAANNAIALFDLMVHKVEIALETNLKQFKPFFEF